jgi:hypothetical protein
MNKLIFIFFILYLCTFIKYKIFYSILISIQNINKSFILQIILSFYFSLQLFCKFFTLSHSILFIIIVNMIINNLK